MSLQKLSDGVMLYHGSYCEICKPDFSKCAPNKDFGQGFYLTSSKEQAEKFVSISIKKAAMQGFATEDQDYGFVSAYRFSYNSEVMEYCYENADTNWLHCIVGHRRPGTFNDVVKQMSKYDIISGKIADDATNFTIIVYLTGAYGNIGTDEADNLCISRLIPERLQDQYCFRTDKALKCLSFAGSEKIWNR